MKEAMIISQGKIQFQKELLDFMNTKLLGIQIWLPEIDSVIPSELGGDLYLFNLSFIGKIKNNYKKLEIHVNEEGKLFLQLIHEIIKSPDWYKSFESVKEFKEQFPLETKKMLAS